MKTTGKHRGISNRDLRVLASNFKSQSEVDRLGEVLGVNPSSFDRFQDEIPATFNEISFWILRRWKEEQPEDADLRDILEERLHHAGREDLSQMIREGVLRVRVIFLYELMSTDEPPLESGESLTLLECITTDGEWWKGRITDRDVEVQSGTRAGTTAEEYQQSNRMYPSSPLTSKQTKDLCRVRIRLDSNLEDSIKLELRRGDVLTALEEEGADNRCTGELSNMIGEFPHEVIEERGESKILHENIASIPEHPRTEGTCHVRVILDCDFQSAVELEMKQGDVITAFEKHNPKGWWKGELSNQPSILSEVIEKYKLKKVKSNVLENVPEQTSVGIIFHYIPMDSRCRQLTKGDQITLIEMDTDDREWWIGKGSNGEDTPQEAEDSDIVEPKVLIKSSIYHKIRAKIRRSRENRDEE